MEGSHLGDTVRALASPSHLHHARSLAFVSHDSVCGLWRVFRPLPCTSIKERHCVGLSRTS